MTDDEIAANRKKLQERLSPDCRTDSANSHIDPSWSLERKKRFQFRKCGSILLTIFITIGIHLAVRIIWAVIEWWWNRQDET